MRQKMNNLKYYLIKILLIPFILENLDKWTTKFNLFIKTKLDKWKIKKN